MENTTNTKHQSPKKQIARQGKMSPPEIESWMTYSWETKQQTPARLEDAAKYLAVMMTVAITLFLGGIGKNAVLTTSSWWIKSIPLLWCLSLILSFLVLYPKKYRFHASSAESIQEMTEKIIQWKQRIFFAASLCFLVGMVLLVWMFIV